MQNRLVCSGAPSLKMIVWYKYNTIISNIIKYPPNFANN